MHNYRQGEGLYKDVGGHHIHATSGFRGNTNYSRNNTFTISQNYMLRKNIDHTVITTTQRRLFTQLASDVRNGIKVNSIAEHSRIAKEALIAAGASEKLANDLVRKSMNILKQLNATVPTRIPWN